MGDILGAPATASGPSSTLKVTSTIAFFGLWAVFGLEAFAADFVVRDVRARVEENRLSLSADVELALSEPAEQAVDNGVVLVLLNEFAIRRYGALWDGLVARQHVRWRLSYHALSDRYVVANTDTQQIKTFLSIAESLRYMGKIDATTELPPMADDTHVVEFRTRLDVNALPAPLRTLALFSSDWRLKSEWTQWKIEH